MRPWRRWHLLHWRLAVLSHRFVLRFKHGSNARACVSGTGMSAVRLWSERPRGANGARSAMRISRPRRLKRRPVWPGLVGRSGPSRRRHDGGRAFPFRHLTTDAPRLPTVTGALCRRETRDRRPSDRRLQARIGVGRTGRGPTARRSIGCCACSPRTTPVDSGSRRWQSACARSRPGRSGNDLDQRRPVASLQLRTVHKDRQVTRTPSCVSEEIHYGEHVALR